MPNGRWTTERAGTIEVESGHVAIIDPLAFADALGIDRDSALATLLDEAAAGRAHQWHTVNGRYDVLKHDHDEGGIAHEVRT